MLKSIPNRKINPKLGLGERTTQKLKPGPKWAQTVMVGKMHLNNQEELVMIWIPLHGLTLWMLVIILNKITGLN